MIKEALCSAVLGSFATILAAQTVVMSDVRKAKASADSHKLIQLEGVLTNAGTNFFTDQRIVLVGKGNQQIMVQPWVPSELGTSPPGSPLSAPYRLSALSGYLDKRVVLTGRVENRSVKGIGLTEVFIVNKAELIK
jgi:hypothetical protein